MSDKGDRKNNFHYGFLCALEKIPNTYPATLRGDIGASAALAAIAGAEALELHVRDPLQYNGRELLAAAKNNGLYYAAISTGLEYVLNGLSLISDNADIRYEAVKKLKEHIDLAESIECPYVVIGVMRGNIPDIEKYSEYESRLTEAVFELSEYAFGRPVGLLIEGINRYVTNYLCSVPETLRYIERLNLPNIKIHIDTHQMNIEDIDFYGVVKSCGKKLGYVHFSDNNRACPGGGNIDFRPVMKALKDISYDGCITIEGIPGHPAADSLKSCIETLRRLESAL